MGFVVLRELNGAGIGCELGTIGGVWYNNVCFLALKMFWIRIKVEIYFLSV